MGKSKSRLAASSKKVDPALASLFSTSAGPAKPLPKSRYAELPPPKPVVAAEESEDEEVDEEDDEELSEIEGDIEDGLDGLEDDSEEASSNNESSDDEDEEDAEADAEDVDDETEAAEVPDVVMTQDKSEEDGRKRKRKQREDDENLEAKYFERLANEDEPSGKRLKDSEGKATPVEKKEEDEDKEDSGDEVPVHESLKADAAASEIEKANRTVFLSNVCIEAVTSRTAKKTLLKHMASILDPKADPPQKVESIRFRSTAFSTAAIPKRAAYIKKSVMEATTKSTNAYVVYSAPHLVRVAMQKLNGTVVLDRHLRVDSVAHPAPVDHKRCVFVGNLGFVDDETVLNVKLDEEGKEITEKKKRTKQPMDVEEGLWRVFGKEAGKVESVRVVRDNVTRVGKGIAYVQFYDGNDVESAVLLNGKKFPPMLPRELRVTRCKAPHKTARAMEAKEARNAPPAKERKGKFQKRGDKNQGGGSYVPKVTAEAQTLAGRASKLLGKSGALQLAGAGKKREKGEHRSKDRQQPQEAAENKSGIKPMESFVFEGRRASEKDGKPKDLKFKGARSAKDKRGYKKQSSNSKGPGGGGPAGRGAARAAKWRAGGGSK
ncbi:putative nucleolar protein 12 [Podospora australis]|uniref:Nucleolar protein 12 n=1 Tax=Podospora australis TaxID=1536484 RepID=A0AAN7ALV3_9PEZI|nr:putative nucleolar protein 12 [Podospora australis]